VLAGLRAPPSPSPPFFYPLARRTTLFFLIVSFSFPHSVAIAAIIFFLYFEPDEFGAESLLQSWPPTSSRPPPVFFSFFVRAASSVFVAYVTFLNTVSKPFSPRLVLLQRTTALQHLIFAPHPCTLVRTFLPVFAHLISLSSF